MFEVIYFSRSGNTKKVAEAIADELGVSPMDIKMVDRLPADSFVFLGTGCYGAVLPAHIARFMNRNRFSGRKITLFTTSAFGSASELRLLEKQLKDKGVNIVESFHCEGHWMTWKKGHPTAEDLAKAREFARMVAQKHAPVTEAKALAAA